VRIIIGFLTWKEGLSNAPFSTFSITFTFLSSINPLTLPLFCSERGCVVYRATAGLVAEYVYGQYIDLSTLEQRLKA